MEYGRRGAASNSEVRHKALGPRVRLLEQTKREGVQVVGTYFAHAHKTTAPLFTILCQVMEDVPRLSVRGMTGDWPA